MIMQVVMLNLTGLSLVICSMTGKHLRLYVQEQAVETHNI